jgi:hypothetical protein
MQHEQEQKIATERRIQYRGTASIALEALHFPCEGSRDIDDRNVERLMNVFREEKCRRLPIQNHVVAEIDQRQLDAALAASGISAEALFKDPCDSYLELDFPPNFRLRCLHGQHRIIAATAVLPPEDRRWTVDFYLAGEGTSCVPHALNTYIIIDLSESLRTTLIEEYSAEKKPDDGYIYRKLRQYQGYHGTSNLYFEKRWWARLKAISSRGEADLRRILKDDEFKDAFDIQLLIPGLSNGMRLATLHKALAMNCREVRNTFNERFKV